MSINTKLQLAVLPVQTRIQSGQISYRFQILFRGFILVLETAFVTFGTRTTQIVIVAEFVVGGTALDLVENSGVDGDWGIETAWARNPGYFCWGSCGTLDRSRFFDWCGGGAIFT